MEAVALFENTLFHQVAPSTEFSGDFEVDARVASFQDIIDFESDLAQFQSTNFDCKPDPTLFVDPNQYCQGYWTIPDYQGSDQYSVKLEAPSPLSQGELSPAAYEIPVHGGNSSPSVVWQNDNLLVSQQNPQGGSYGGSPVSQGTVGFQTYNQTHSTCETPQTVASPQSTMEGGTSPVYSISDDGSATGTPEIENIELYHELIMPWIAHDVSTQAMRWRIPQNPQSWDMEDSKKWWVEVAKAHSIDTENWDLSSWNWNGRELCELTPDEFVQMNTDHGEKLHGCLNIWKSAYEYTIQQQEGTHNSVNSSKSKYNSSSAARSAGYTPSSTATAALNRYKNFNVSNAFNRFDAYGVRMSKSLPTEIVFGSMTPQINEMEATHSSSSSHIQLWRFIRQLLENPVNHNVVRWVNRDEGIFKIEDSRTLATMWGRRKNRPAMNYDKLSRSLRQYYKKGILKKTSRAQRLVYQFCPTYRYCTVNQNHWTETMDEVIACTNSNESIHCSRQQVPMVYDSGYQGTSILPLIRCMTDQTGETSSNFYGDAIDSGVMLDTPYSQYESVPSIDVDPVDFKFDHQV